MPALPPTLGDEPASSAGQPLLYNLVYCSRAAPGVDDAAVNQILASARRWNPVYGVTGLLVYGSGIFFQWLEGPRVAVLGLMDKLRADPRHSQVVPLAENEEQRERLFPDWDMERVSAEHIREVLQDAHDSADDPGNAQVLARLLTELDSGALQGIQA